MEEATGFDVALVFHVIIVACFVILGGFENFVIIFMLHKKKKLNSGQKFMLCLAYVDLFVCFYCVPMIPVYIYIHGRSASIDNILVPLYRLPCSTVVTTYITVTITMALDRVHATSRPYSYKPPTMTSFLWIFLAVGIYAVVYFLALIGWLPDIVWQIQTSALWVTALLIVVSCYTVVVYKVKRQGRKIAAPSSGGGGAPAKPNAAAMTANTSKSGTSPPAAEVSNTGTKPASGAANSSHQAAQGNQAPPAAATTATTTATDAAAAKKGESKMETRMLKLCLGITCLSVVTYTTLFIRIALDLPRSLDYIYFLNHVGNPVIYCMIRKAYRKDVLDTARLILGTIKKTILRR